MKVLVINGSPRRQGSNTLQLTKAFLEGANFADVQTVHVAEENIKPCLGCFACWNKTPGHCVQEDDMAGVLEKLVQAQVVVWSFPLYYYGVPGGLKNLIDRQLPLNLPFMQADAESGGHPSRYALSHQRHVVISTCGFWTAKGNYGGVTAMFDRHCGSGGYTSIFCGQGELFRVPELRSRTDEYLNLVRQAGAQFAGGGITPETQARLEMPLYPKAVFEKMADASWGLPQEGQQEAEPGLGFTQQMAALYSPDGKERVLEMHYVDIGKTYQILLTPEGAEVIHKDLRPYTTQVSTPLSVWKSIAEGKISGPEALAQGKYRVQGDFSLMLHWDALFNGGVATADAQESHKKEKHTNMLVLLLPWMTIWIVLAIHSRWGGVLGLLAVSLMPLLGRKYKPVVFEQLSAPLVASLALLALLGADLQCIMPLSYLLFGAMWLVGAGTKIPLTAHYSARGYGGEQAFANPLFMQTNRILTALWGVLYLATAVWTYFLVGTPLAPYAGLINSACPVLMGMFTAWFQAWYPAHRARGSGA